MNESKEKEEEFHTYDHLKHLHNNHLSYAPKDIKDLVLKKVFGITKENIFSNNIFYSKYCLGDNLKIKKEYSKIYFWTSKLNDQLSRELKTNFKSY